MIFEKCESFCLISYWDLLLCIGQIGEEHLEVVESKKFVLFDHWSEFRHKVGRCNHGIEVIKFSLEIILDGKEKNRSYAWESNYRKNCEIYYVVHDSGVCLGVDYWDESLLLDMHIWSGINGGTFSGHSLIVNLLLKVHQERVGTCILLLRERVQGGASLCSHGWVFHHFFL